LQRTKRRQKSVMSQLHTHTRRIKKVKALRRRYQRTLNNEDLRSERKNQYNEWKLQYQLKLKEENFKSWQKYCSSTEESNPWNTIYKTASGKSRSTTCLTTLQQPDGTFTLDTESTTKRMLDYFFPPKTMRQMTVQFTSRLESR